MKAKVREAVVVRRGVRWRRRGRRDEDGIGPVWSLMYGPDGMGWDEMRSRTEKRCERFRGG